MHRTKVLGALTALVAASVMAASPGVSAQSPAPEAPTIGLVIPLISNPYWKLIQDFTQGAAGTLGVNLLRQGRQTAMRLSRSPSWRRGSRQVDVVFTQTPDPVAAGFVASLARPGGNATGFTQVEYGTASKWLELLKEIAPHVTRAAILRDPAVPEGIGQFTVIQSAAPALKVEVSPVDIRNAGEIERALTEFARSPNGGLILTSSALANVQRDLIIRLAAKLQLPAVYSFGFFASAGGLIAYGSDSIDPHRRAASYVDRILKGEKPADLPVQAPTKYELVINLKTAKALGLAMPPSVLARADKVIE